MPIYKNGALSRGDGNENEDTEQKRPRDAGKEDKITANEAAENEEENEQGDDQGNEFGVAEAAAYIANLIQEQVVIPELNQNQGALPAAEQPNNPDPAAAEQPNPDPAAAEQPNPDPAAAEQPNPVDNQDIPLDGPVEDGDAQ